MKSKKFEVGQLIDVSKCTNSSGFNYKKMKNGLAHVTHVGNNIVRFKSIYNNDICNDFTKDSMNAKRTKIIAKSYYDINKKTIEILFGNHNEK